MQTEALLEGVRAEIQTREQRISEDQAALEKLREVERIVGELNGGGSVAPSPAPAPASPKPTPARRRPARKPETAPARSAPELDAKILAALEPFGAEWVAPSQLELDADPARRRDAFGRLARAGKIERKGNGRGARLRLKRAERAIPGPTPSGTGRALADDSLEDRIVAVLEENGERTGDDLYKLVDEPGDVAMAVAMKTLLVQKRIQRIPKHGRVVYALR